MKLLYFTAILLSCVITNAAAELPTLYPVEMTSGSIIIENKTLNGDLLASLTPLNNAINEAVYSYPATAYIASYTSNLLAYKSQLEMPWSYATNAPSELPHQPDFSTSLILQQGSLRCTLGITLYPQLPTLSSAGAYFVGGNFGEPMSTCSMDKENITISTEANNTLLVTINKLKT